MWASPKQPSRSSISSSCAGAWRGRTTGPIAPFAMASQRDASGNRPRRRRTSSTTRASARSRSIGSPRRPIERLFCFDEPISESAGHALMAIASLAAGDEAGFLEHERRWRGVVDSRGLSWLGAIQALVIAGVETWIGKPEAAERRLRAARDVLVPLGDIWWIGSLDSALCAAVAAQGESQRFLRLADAFDASPPVPDRQALIRGSLLRSRAFLLRGRACRRRSRGEARRRAGRADRPRERSGGCAQHARRRPRCAGPRGRGHDRTRERRGPAPGEGVRGGSRRTRKAVVTRRFPRSSGVVCCPQACPGRAIRLAWSHRGARFRLLAD